MSDDIIDFYKKVVDQVDPESTVSDNSKQEIVADPFQRFLSTLAENLEKTEPKEFKQIEEQEVVTDPFAKFLSNMASIVKEDKKVQTDEQIKEATIGFINKLKTDNNVSEVETQEEVTPVAKKLPKKASAKVTEKQNTVIKKIPSFNTETGLPEIQEQKEVENVAQPQPTAAETPVKSNNTYVKELSQADKNKKIPEKIAKGTDIKSIIEKQVREAVNKLRQEFGQNMMSSGGGGTVAVQYADGGTMTGDLNVTGKYLSGGRDLATIFTGGGGGQSDRLVAGSESLILNSNGTLTIPNNTIRLEDDINLVLESESSPLQSPLTGTLYNRLFLSPYGFFAYDNNSNSITIDSVGNDITLTTLDNNDWIFGDDGTLVGPNSALSIRGTLSSLGPILSGGRDLADIFLTSATDNQTLSYNASSYNLSISNGNTVSLSSLASTNLSNYLPLSGGSLTGPVNTNSLFTTTNIISSLNSQINVVGTQTGYGVNILNRTNFDAGQPLTVDGRVRFVHGVNFASGIANFGPNSDHTHVTWTTPNRNTWQMIQNGDVSSTGRNTFTFATIGFITNSNFFNEANIYSIDTTSVSVSTDSLYTATGIKVNFNTDATPRLSADQFVLMSFNPGAAGIVANTYSGTVSSGPTAVTIDGATKYQYVFTLVDFTPANWYPTKKGTELIYLNANNVKNVRISYGPTAIDGTPVGLSANYVGVPRFVLVEMTGHDAYAGESVILSVLGTTKIGLPPGEWNGYVREVIDSNRFVMSIGTAGNWWRRSPSGTTGGTGWALYKGSTDNFHQHTPALQHFMYQRFPTSDTSTRTTGGNRNVALGNSAEVDGDFSYAVGYRSAIFPPRAGATISAAAVFGGDNNYVYGNNSTAVGGQGLIVSGSNQFVTGKFNAVRGSNDIPFVVGWGTGNNNRSNLLELASNQFTVNVPISTNIIYTSSGNSNNWNSAYNIATAYQSASSSFATNDFVNSNFFNLTGGTISGATRINNNLTVFGNLTATGTTTFANTIFSVTSALSVVHVGSGPAMYVGNNGDGDIASFYDLDQGIEVFHVGGNNGSFPNVGVKTSSPNVDFTVNGQISANNIIWSAGGNSNNWNSSFTTLCANSATWVKFQPLIYNADNASDVYVNGQRLFVSYPGFYYQYMPPDTIFPFYLIREEGVGWFYRLANNSEEGYETLAQSNDDAAYPWLATWIGISVTKAPTQDRIIPKPLSAADPFNNTTYFEGSSIYAARADHSHVYPTPIQIGAAPTVHTHTISDVTNLQTTLNNKLNASAIDIVWRFQDDVIPGFVPNQGSIIPVNGNNNIVKSDYSIVNAGQNNVIFNNQSINVDLGSYGYGPSGYVYGSIIAGGNNNNIGANSSNTIVYDSENDFYYGNVFYANIYNSSILGGLYNTISAVNPSQVPNSIFTANYNTIVGGVSGSIYNGDYNFIGGGRKNTVYGNYNSIINGQNNTLSGTNSFILGSNISASTSNYTFVNNLSSQGIVASQGGNSNNWNSAYNISTAYQGISSNFLTDAPSNGIQYVRKNGAWTAVVTTSGGGDVGSSAYSFVDTNFSALANQKYLVDTRYTSIVGTLPDSPAVGDNISFVDSYNTWDSKPLILNNNGNLLQTFNEPLTANISGYQFQLVYIGGPFGWKII